MILYNNKSGLCQSSWPAMRCSSHVAVNPSGSVRPCTTARCLVTAQISSMACLFFVLRVYTFRMQHAVTRPKQNEGYAMCI